MLKKHLGYKKVQGQEKNQWLKALMSTEAKKSVSESATLSSDISYVLRPRSLYLAS